MYLIEIGFKYAVLPVFLMWLSSPLSGVGAEGLPWIRSSADKTHFVLQTSQTSQTPVKMWGFNYDRDWRGRLLEDYWEREWSTVEGDFREMKALGANVARIHLQLARFMSSTNEANATNLARLAKLVKLAEETGLYLDVTGLGCYHKQDIPAWYDALDEPDRWEVQARFWKEVAGVCKGSPAIFCYDLMNEPVIGGTRDQGWLPGEPLGGKYYVQKLTLDKRGRTDKEIAKAWVQKLAASIRAVDERHMITVGVIPWAQVFKGAKPLFYSPEVSAPLDFVSIHFYPKAVDVKESLAALRVYDVGKPLLIEEIFPIHASIDKTAEFINAAHPSVDGFVSFYWGRTIEELHASATASDQITASWLERFHDLGRTADHSPPPENAR
jgi:hypothetical protein